ncbi:LysE family translocator [Roseibium polysiphoniae]|uniref:LysE family translocator n=1 Tax=Roseibium polysiphoniae TaxID=2571221 RepID=A0ABR9CDX0_9HYPH|nr:LysE family translocator [Roseibium polysiphoniae]MBD8877838.1 LysE family translocator [Roseibium polysiphoniae]
MSFEIWLAFVAASLILTMTPGPSILLGVVHALKYGACRTIFTALGDISANMLQMTIVALGLGVVIATSPVAFQVIKWFGVAALVYMSVKMLRARPAAAVSIDIVEEGSRLRLFSSGFVVALGNPKALVFFSAFFPQFLDPTLPVWPQLVAMCPTMAVLDFSWVMLYALTARKFLQFLGQHPTALNRTGGSALLGAAGYLSLS